MEYIYFNGIVVILAFTVIGATVMDTFLIAIKNGNCKSCGKKLTATDIFFSKDKCFSCSQKQNQNEK